MKLMRNSIFETNSSSTHSLVILSKDEYNKWLDHKVTLDISRTFGTVEELTKEDKEIKRFYNGGPVEYKGKRFDSIRDLMEDKDTYDVIADENASSEYVDIYADVVKKEEGDKVILSIYREDGW